MTQTSLKLLRKEVTVAVTCQCKLEVFIKTVTQKKRVKLLKLKG